jgi:hypothetical protein
MLDWRACGKSIYGARSAAFLGPANQLLFYCTNRGEPLRTFSIERPGVSRSDDRRRPKSGEPEMGPCSLARLRKRACIGLGPRMRSSAACASAGYDRIN